MSTVVGFSRYFEAVSKILHFFASALSKNKFAENVLCARRSIPEAPMSHLRTGIGELFVYLLDAQTQMFLTPTAPTYSG